MIDRRRVLTLSLMAMAGCGAVFAAARLFQPAQGQRRGPPWAAPVTSSESFRVGGATIQVDFGDGTVDLPRPQVMRWVENAASSVATYYGRFPVARDRILIQPREDERGVQGTTWGGVGGFPAFSRMRLGEQTTADDLNDDWTMTHELVHTAFPSQEDDQHWIEEGLAVYVEPIARVQNGLLPAEKIWSDMVRDMPKGNPGSSDGGLDETHSWGRTYWGGAQFCLLADVTIREQTHNRKGLQDALRAIVAAGGTIDQEWPIGKAFAAGDAGTGTHVLEDMYDRMSRKPVTVDLDGIWKKLGVVRSGNGVRFDDHAPEAAIRIAITKTPKSGRILPVTGETHAAGE
ncbi:hypothetical protein [Paracidobacterium acidisoli]|uniref:Peptidase M61 catalytic domain-containing protein n=1 Tax=Paracidobacterium acidisoli TaxID=2303751 RepID=A0A372IQ97_9BACT|nr:hypothetical protein [Paracidobacterium acidisoli]MBT9331418.1 hypothetical protein [Paracidobacterium acidisoli]